jgi:hypothetical protein
MAVQFSRREPGKDALADDTFQPLPPQRTLDRHGAVVLRPGTAVVAAGWAPPRPTVYRAASLLIPEDVLRDEATAAAINRVLADVGMQFVAPPPLARLDESLARYEEYLGELPRAVALRVRPGARPTTVDSWTAVQQLRAAASGERPVLPPSVVERISVEHLMRSTVTINGTPGSWESSGVDGTDSYVRARTGNRIPVALSAAPPPRRASLTGRRPVVAVFDSGVAPHPWFGIADRTGPPPAGGFVSVLSGLQQAILTQEEYQANWQATQFLLDYWDAPASAEPLLGDVDTDTGHGTFIAGIVRQVAPDTSLLAIRVTHSDGVVYEGDILLALWRIAAQVAQAQQDDEPDGLVDVVSLSLGYFDESPTTGGYTSHIAQVVGRLVHHGVLVVAAAGNDSTTRRFYPAALAGVPQAPGGGPAVVSVGALNPNGSKALFSNDGSWVHYWATGAAVVSTYPVDVQGSGGPESTMPSATMPGLPPRRDALDPDDFSCGFAVWDGTSFAAPLAAAKLAETLIRDAEEDHALRLDNADRSAMVERSAAAHKGIG